MNAPDHSKKRWDTLARSRAARLARAQHLASGCIVPADRIVQLLEAVIEPGEPRGRACTLAARQGLEWPANVRAQTK